MGRAPCCDKGKVKKGPWSIEEDTLLRNFIINFGNGGNWISLPKKAGLNRCGKSCRLRWLNYLRPGINHGDFTEEEDRMIYTLYLTLGSRWSLIAANLKGRTDNDVKNYWNTKLKRKIKEGKFNYSNNPNNNTMNNLQISCNIDTTIYETLDNEMNYQNQLEQSKDEEEEKKEAKHNNATMSHALLSSSSNFVCFEYQNSSSSGSIMSEISVDNDQDEIWMDELLFESFDDELFSIQLEEKIIEIASLLDF